MTPEFTQDQVNQFLDYIQLPQEYRSQPPTLDLLCTLHTYMISAVPYENLSVHYNPSHKIIIDPQHVFDKVVSSRRGRGGYCMEVSVFYNRMLIALGFDAYTVGARTRRRLKGFPEGDYPGWIHIVNIVTFADGPRYHVDVAFGGDGAISPMPLEENQEQDNLGTQTIRLIRDWIPAQVHRTEASKNWIYQYRNSQDQEWNSFYSFVEHEFTLNDWQVVNHYACTNLEGSWHPSTVLCIKFLRQSTDDGREIIHGKRMMANDVVKENLGGKTYVVKTCSNEEERVKILDEFFGLKLTGEEIAGIRGFRSELREEEGGGEGQTTRKPALFS